MDDYKYHPRGGARGDGTPPFEYGVREGAVSSPAPPPRLLRLCPLPYFFYTPKFLGRASGWGGGANANRPRSVDTGGAAC